MISSKEYQHIVKKTAPKSNGLTNCLRAFFIGGGICAVGQGILELYQAIGIDEDSAKTLTSVTLILVGVILTALGVYDKIANKGGAGTLVPITGFANSVSSSAIEFKHEGFISGLGTKMFIIAGPVIVYGVAASIIYGVILWVLHMFGITLF